MQPFNLERFKAGEPAYNNTTHLKYLYITDLQEGRYVTKYEWTDGWWSQDLTLQYLENATYMKEKELLTWDELLAMYGKAEVTRFQSFGLWLIKNCEPPKLKNK